MERLLQGWDGEGALIRHDAESGAWMFIALHDRSLGPALGGCRLHVYAGAREGLADALRLARAMTLKWAALDFPFGGGKSVLAVPAPLHGDERASLLRRFGELVDSLGGGYGTGTDLGTTSADMNVIGTRTRFVCGRTPDAGGCGSPGPWTALGVFAGLRAACRRVFGTDDVGGRTILVQGAGDVGAPLARRLSAAGARLLVADAIPGRAESIARELDALVVAPDKVYETECDVFAPCAIGGVLNGRSIQRLQCRIVLGSANNQLEDEEADAERLHERGIIYAPDFVANAGGAIALAALELLRWSPRRVERRVRDLGDAMGRILDEALAADEPPLHHARRQAEQVLARARASRAERPSAAPAESVLAIARG